MKSSGTSSGQSDAFPALYRRLTLCLCALAGAAVQLRWIWHSPVVWRYSVLDSFGSSYTRYLSLSLTPKGIVVGLAYWVATGIYTGLNMVVFNVLFRLAQFERVSVANLLRFGRRRAWALALITALSALLAPTLRTIRIGTMMDDGMGTLVDKAQ